MNQRQEFVKEARRETVSFSALCHLFGISRKTGYKWLARANGEGRAGLRDRSRRPRSNSRAVSKEVINRVVALRRKHKHWGARKLIGWLETNEPHWQLPAPSTVTGILKRHGLVVNRRKSRRGTWSPSPLAAATAPNVIWSVDFKGNFKVGDGTRCHPLTVTDAYSRMALCCRALTTPALVPTQKALERTFRQWGLPERLRSDNGTPFGTSCTGPLSRLSVWLVKLGVRPEYIAPGHPEQNGRHERFHRTLKQECCYPPATSIAAQQQRFNRFRRTFNDVRPHEALGQNPPSSVHLETGRPFPRRLEELTYPAHYELRRVSSVGYIRWHGTRYFLSESLGGENVGIVELGVGNWEIHFGHLPIGRFHEALPKLGLIRPAKLLPMSPV